MDNQSNENDHSKWIWGMFYYNKNDDRIFPPKRNPAFGWTINFANPKSILVMIIFLAFFAFVTFMIERSKP